MQRNRKTIISKRGETRERKEGGQLAVAVIVVVAMARPVTEVPNVAKISGRTAVAATTLGVPKRLWTEAACG